MADPLTQPWLDEIVDRLDVSASSANGVFEITVLGGPDGDVPTVWTVNNGKVTAAPGVAPDSDVAMTIPWNDALAIVRGTLEPAVAYMQGKLKPSGNMTLVLEVLALGSTSAAR